ncbi:MAG TPA: mechanosensitive ion channel, partial [Saprospiraceae bacterium]|nr:mechanosensitive ion channel [Saprospiraceae bacterium]
EIVAKIIYIFLLLIFIVAATDILGMPALSNLVASAIAFIPNLIVALIIIIVGLLGADAMRKLTLTTCESLGISNAKLIASFVFYFLFVTVFMMALSQANIDTQFLATNLSILIAGGVLAFSIGYGLASKETVANYLASRYNKGKLKIGDIIEVDGLKGVIIKLESDSLTIEHEVGTTILPLHLIMNNKVKIFK